MPGHDIIVIGASAGGVEAITQIVRDLPSDLPAAVFVVLHIPAQGTSVFPNILNRAIQKSNKNSSLQAIHPTNGELIQHGRIYVAPPDQHLLIKEGYIRLARGPKENSHRPAVDPLFRTAAYTYGPRVVGVVLSGTLDDGTAGLAAVKHQNGVAIVQDPDEALYSGMPSSAVENVSVDHILPVSEIAPLLVELACKPVQNKRVAVSKEMQIEADIAELELEAMQKHERPGKPSPFACPDCNGVLWELEEGSLMRFRCRTGHAFSVGSLLAKQSDALEEALWNALRALEEKAALASRMAKRASERNQKISAKRFTQQAKEEQQRAILVRQLLLKDENNEQLSTVDGQIVGANGLIGIEGVRNNEKAPPDPHLKVVAICASAEGLQALSEVLSALPKTFPAAITVVQNLTSSDPNYLVDTLSQHTALNVKQAEEGEALRGGTVYIAPISKHLLVNPDQTLSLSYSKLVHFVRPSADLLFESVAGSFKEQAIALILIGTGNDGTMGIQAIKQMGGTTIIQEQATSELGLPQANDTGSEDWILPLNEIASTLISIVNRDNEYDYFGAKPRI